MGVTSTLDVTGRQLPLVTGPAGELEMIGSMSWGHACPDLLWQPRKVKKVENAGKSSRLWEESEMGLQGKIGAGIETRALQPC